MHLLFHVLLPFITDPCQWGKATQEVATTTKTRRTMAYNKGKVSEIPSHQLKMLKLYVATTARNFQ